MKDIVSDKGMSIARRPLCVPVQVHRMKLATVLQGPHRGSQVSAVAWCPHHHPHDAQGAGSALRCFTCREQPEWSPHPRCKMFPSPAGTQSRVDETAQQQVVRCLGL